MLLALRELHDLGIASRDVKADNVVVGAAADGYPRLVDLGLARSVRPAGAPCGGCGERGTDAAAAAAAAENLPRSADGAGLRAGLLAAAAARLAQLPCCACSCVTPSEAATPGGAAAAPAPAPAPALSPAAAPAPALAHSPCARLHRYHSPAESLAHLAKLWLRFPAAATAHAHSHTPADGDAGRERARSVVGSPAYMAPEVATGDTGHDCAADVWSFGVLAHELLAGVSPFSPRALRCCGGGGGGGGAGGSEKRGGEEASNDDDDDDDSDGGDDDNPAEIALRAAAAEIDVAALAARAGDAAAELVRAALEPHATRRPCVHVLMRHRFFAGGADGGADGGDSGGTGAGARATGRGEGATAAAEAAEAYFAALRERRIAPPPPPLPRARARPPRSGGGDGGNGGGSCGLPCAAPARFGDATFLARAAEDFAARRAAGLLGLGGGADTHDVAREFADAGVAGADEAALAIGDECGNEDKGEAALAGEGGDEAEGEGAV